MSTDTDIHIWNTRELSAMIYSLFVILIMLHMFTNDLNC